MAVRLGQENGYTFTAEDVKAFINQKSQEANPELIEILTGLQAGEYFKYVFPILRSVSGIN